MRGRGWGLTARKSDRFLPCLLGSFGFLPSASSSPFSLSARGSTSQGPAVALAIGGATRAGGEAGSPTVPPSGQCFLGPALRHGSPSLTPAAHHRRPLRGGAERRGGRALRPGCPPPCRGTSAGGQLVRPPDRAGPAATPTFRRPTSGLAGSTRSSRLPPVGSRRSSGQGLPGPWSLCSSRPPGLDSPAALIPRLPLEADPARPSGQRGPVPSPRPAGVRLLSWTCFLRPSPVCCPPL